MERLDRDISSTASSTGGGDSEMRRSVKQELMSPQSDAVSSSPSGRRGSGACNFTKDKENSEPMDIGSPQLLQFEPISQMDEPLSPATAAFTGSQPNPLFPSSMPSLAPGASHLSASHELSQLRYTPAHSKAPCGNSFTPAGAAAHGCSTGQAASTLLSNLPVDSTSSAGGSRSFMTTQSLSQIMNLPSSTFSFELGDLQSPVGSGFVSPLGSGKLGKKRPLSISPLSGSSINIDTLVRGSPTSLLNFITQSRNSSSAGSFGHLSPSLFALPSSHSGIYNRPSISLSKAVHPFSSSSLQFPSTAVSSASSHEQRNELSLEDKKPLLLHNGVVDQVTMTSESADIADHHDISIQPLMKASLEQESEGELSIPAEPLQSSDYSSAFGESTSESEHKPFQKHSNSMGRRIYYAYPQVEEPHNNCCQWEGCQQQCESLDHLVNHVNSDHIYQESRKEFVCRWTRCVRERRPFKAQYMLLVHMRRHTGEKPHRCHYEGCEKAYSRLENLKTHLRSHTGEKPYLCKYEGCGKAFSNASDCAKHMNRTHSDEKPYSCLNPGCTKRYTDPSSRRKHMKNCQVNKKARTISGESFDGDESSLETGIVNSAVDSSAPSSTTATAAGAGGKSPPQGGKKTSKPRKNEKKRREDSKQLTGGDFSQQNSNNMDLGYMSGESQCTPLSILTATRGGPRTHLSNSGYNLSGYDTEYPSLPEDHSIPPLVSVMSDHSTNNGGHYTGHDTIVKTEQFSPSSQMCEHYPYQLSQAPPPYHSAHYKQCLHPLPEVQPFGPSPHHQGSYHHNYSQVYPMEAAAVAAHSSSGYSSFGGSPIRMMGGGASDDSASLMSGSGQHSFKGSSDLTSSSRSSFSTLSSRLSSPVNNRDYSKHSYRNLRPPDLILRPHQPYSVQMADIKSHVSSCYHQRQTDEMSLRSSNSSRYSGSEFSDDLSRHSAMGGAPPLPAPPKLHSSPREPLPLPQSMQHEFMGNEMVAMTTDPQYPGGKELASPASSYHHTPYSAPSGGSVPLKHFEPHPPAMRKQPPLPMIYESQIQTDSSNMVIGSMAFNASQLHQDNLLFESLSSSNSSYIELPN